MKGSWLNMEKMKSFQAKKGDIVRLSNEMMSSIGIRVVVDESAIVTTQVAGGAELKIEVLAGAQRLNVEIIDADEAQDVRFQHEQ